MWIRDDAIPEAGLNPNLLSIRPLSVVAAGLPQPPGPHHPHTLSPPHPPLLPPHSPPHSIYLGWWPRTDLSSYRQ